MAKQVCIIGGGVIGLASAYALVRAGHEVTLIDARDTLGSETSFANGGQLSYRYVMTIGHFFIRRIDPPHKATAGERRFQMRAIVGRKHLLLQDIGDLAAGMVCVSAGGP